MWIYMWILFIHWIADFIAQTKYQAENKSKSNRALFDHVSSYLLITVAGWAPLYYRAETMGGWAIFVIITFVAHYCQDWVTSRVNRQLWEKKDFHNFFVSIGFDQLLHFVQLFAMWVYLFN